MRRRGYLLGRFGASRCRLGWERQFWSHLGAVLASILKGFWVPRAQDGRATPWCGGKNIEGLHPSASKAPTCGRQNGGATPWCAEGPVSLGSQTGQRCPSPGIPIICRNNYLVFDASYCHKTPRKCLKSLQDSLKMAQEASKSGPKMLSRSPNRPPRSLQDTP